MTDVLVIGGGNAALCAALTEQALLEHCRQHLTGYKMPKIVEFRSEPLPKSNIGKILRRELRHAAETANAAAPPVASN